MHLLRILRRIIDIYIVKYITFQKSHLYYTFLQHTKSQFNAIVTAEKSPPALNPTHTLSLSILTSKACVGPRSSLCSHNPKTSQTLLVASFLNEKTILSIHKPPLSTLQLRVIHHVRLGVWRDLQNCRRLSTTLHMLCSMRRGSLRSRPSDPPPEPHMAEITWFCQWSLGVDTPCLWRHIIIGYTGSKDKEEKLMLRLWL